MPRAKEGIFLRYTNTSCIYKVHIPARSHTFAMSVLDVKFEDTTTQSVSTADSCPGAEVIMEEVIMPDVNLSYGPTTMTSIPFIRPITHLMIDSQQSLLLQYLLQQSFQPQQLQTTAVVIPCSMPDSHHNQYIDFDDNHDEQVMITLDKYINSDTE